MPAKLKPIKEVVARTQPSSRKDDETARDKAKRQPQRGPGSNRCDKPGSPE